MGACGAKLSAEEKEAIRKNKEVEAIAAEAYRKEREKIKLLLLGAGESGKSTVFKQMKILYGVMTDEEKRQIRPVVYNNTLVSMKTLVDQVSIWNLDGTVVAQEAFHTVKATDEAAVIDVALGTALKALWVDPGILGVWERRSEFQIVESVKFYFGELDRIMQPDYLPSQQDVLYARVRTSGIVTERYEIDSTTFEMYDVGGQRNERKKWIHCFDDVTAVIFVSALSEYDQSLFEDATTNRMVEAIELFGEICNNRYFQDSSMILFLNKKDLYEDKIKKVDIKSIDAFSDFPGGLGDAEKGIEYFTGLFLAVNTNPARCIYSYVTCATDTDNVNKVFSACKDIILRGNLKDSGFI
ncbi:GPA1, alpha subunit of a heterotrimeric G protein [Tribonema minus]|uniref:GPA1, alpha subunit of a heterotrimeric G protein n=1 Tax=Tribonema minus TaxID=303371 RepID=A0A836CAY4_9STRA|nr:GPA1, alpha subunit of a heterotrimeric G protein [Tribonema minus]